MMACPASPLCCCRAWSEICRQVAASSASVAAWTPGSGGVDGLGDAGVHPVGDRRRAVLVLAGGVGLDERGCGERGEEGGGLGRVAGLAEAPPQVGPVGVDDPGLPVIVFEAGQELGHQPGRVGESVHGGGGPGSQGVQELGGVQGGGAVAEERVQDPAACCCLGGVELGGRAGPGRRAAASASSISLGWPCTTCSTRRTRSRSRRHRRLIGSGPARRRRAAGRAGRAARGPAPRTRPGPGRAPAAPAPIPEPGGRDAAGQDHPGLPAMAGQRGHQRLPPRVPPGPGGGEQGFQVIQHQQDPGLFQQPPQPGGEPGQRLDRW